jgi:hypothetical protein
MFRLLLMAITWYPRAGHLNMFPQWIALGSSHFFYQPLNYSLCQLEKLSWVL